MTTQDAYELVKWAAIREAVYVGVYHSALNISKEGYRVWRGRGGVAVGQLALGLGKGAWKFKKFLGWTAVLAASSWSLQSLFEKYPLSLPTDIFDTSGW